MKRCHLTIIVIVLAVIIISLGWYNIKVEDAGFWTVTAFDCLSLLIVVGVSFFIVERQTDKRRQKEIFISLLEALKILTEDKASYDFSNLSWEEVLMRQRDIGLKLELVKECSSKFGIDKDYKFLDDKFQEYQRIIENHPSNMDLLRQLHKELYRPLNLMSQRIFEIMIGLYN